MRVGGRALKILQTKHGADRYLAVGSPGHALAEHQSRGSPPEKARSPAAMASAPVAFAAASGAMAQGSPSCVSCAEHSSSFHLPGKPGCSRLGLCLTAGQCPAADAARAVHPLLRVQAVNVRWHLQGLATAPRRRLPRAPGRLLRAAALWRRPMLLLAGVWRQQCQLGVPCGALPAPDARIPTLTREAPRSPRRDELLHVAGAARRKRGEQRTSGMRCAPSSVSKPARLLLTSGPARQNVPATPVVLHSKYHTVQRVRNRLAWSQPSSLRSGMWPAEGSALLLAGDGRWLNGGGPACETVRCKDEKFLSAALLHVRDSSGLYSKVR